MAKRIILPGMVQYGILATRDNAGSPEVDEFECAAQGSVTRETVWKLAEKMAGRQGWTVCAMRVVGGAERSTAWLPQHLFVGGAATAPKN